LFNPKVKSASELETEMAKHWKCVSRFPKLPLGTSKHQSLFWEIPKRLGNSNKVWKIPTKFWKIQRLGYSKKAGKFQQSFGNSNKVLEIPKVGKFQKFQQSLGNSKKRWEIPAKVGIIQNFWNLMFSGFIVGRSYNFW